MVLPGTFVTAIVLLFLATICFALWPVIFKLAAPNWRFELFSMDFGVGAVLLAALAAFTFGSRGSELGFSDNMLVAGQRAEAVAVLAGMAFALGNLCLLAAIAILGLVNAGLLTFSVFGCVIACCYLHPSFYVTSILALAILILGSALSVVSAASANPVKPKVPAGRPGSSRRVAQQREISPATKGSVVGILGGLAFGGVFPLIRMAQPDQLGIGAYGGILLASLGAFAATIGLNFFFMNISLQGSTIGYGSYLSGTLKNHFPGVISGAVFTLGALSLFAAYTGATSLTPRQAWIAPFAGGLFTILSGLGFAHKLKSKNMTIPATVAFILGITALLSGFHS